MNHDKAQTPVFIVDKFGEAWRVHIFTDSEETRLRKEVYEKTHRYYADRSEALRAVFDLRQELGVGEGEDWETFKNRARCEDRF